MPDRAASAATSDLPHGVGVGYRKELARDLWRSEGALDFVELLCESALSTPAATREAEALAERFPLFVHGVKLSLGSAEGIDAERARRLGKLAKRVGAKAVTEHASFVKAGGVDIGHLSPLPFCTAAAEVIASNAGRARRFLPDVPLLIENAAWPLRPPGDCMAEGDFHAEIVERSGCDLLLDLGNVLANARNSGQSPIDLAASYPLERCSMIHIAGGLEKDGFYFDTHGHPTPDAVFELLTFVLRRTGDVPIILERDEGFPRFDELRGELGRARAIQQENRSQTNAGGAGLPSNREAGDTGGPSEKELGVVQRMIARSFTDRADNRLGLPTAALGRAREILWKKRREEALAWLPRLSRAGHGAVALAERHVASTAALARHAGAADALAIAAAAQQDPRLACAARVDALMLEAAFATRPDGLQERVLPWYGSAEVGGHKLFALRGFGPRARVHLFHGGRDAG